MNLIEQLGGYDKAKSIVDKSPCKTYTYHNHPYQKGYIRCWCGDGKDYFLVSDIEKSLLEYRRQHNIFEVGDKVVKTHPKNTILWPVLGVYKNGGVWLDYKGFCWKPPRVRHATDAEIKAGKRLEVV